MTNRADAEPSPPPAKVDPETLVLRAAPRPVVRFRRGLIVGLAAATSAGLVLVAWSALEPPSFRAAPGDGGEASTKAEPDALADLPATYGDVPRLGPKLPGDLGGPILDHQRDLEARRQAAALDAAESGAERARAAEAERERRQAARDAARASAVIVQLAGGDRPEARTAADPAAGDGEPGPAPQEGAGASRPGLEAAAARPASSSRVLSAGTIIPASLITGLNSDLPGLVLAQVTEDVRDSATGRTVLVPQGARLVGSYDNDVAFGQRRALLVWQRIVFPDGGSVELDNAPATDASGYAGVEDEVDGHGGRLLKGIALATLLGVGTELTLGSEESDLVRALRESTQQNAARAGDRITARNLDVQPTLTVRPGWPVRAILRKDILLAPWRG